MTADNLPQVGGYPEPDGTQPMSAAELRMVRNSLGVTGDWLSRYLNVDPRTARHWERGQSPVPDAVRHKLEALEARRAEDINALVDQLHNATDHVLTIPRHESESEMPPGWWLSVAHRVAEIVPGLHVRYP